MRLLLSVSPICVIALGSMAPCAAAVAAIHMGKATSPVQVRAPGGVQTVEWDGVVHLTGPATLLCRGEFFI